MAHATVDRVEGVPVLLPLRPPSAAPLSDERGNGKGERDSPGGDRGNQSRTPRSGHRSHEFLPDWSPRSSGTGASKTQHASISEPIGARAGMNGTNLRAPGVPVRR